MPEERYAVSDEDRAEFVAWIGSLRDAEGQPVPALIAKQMVALIDAELVMDGWCTKCGGRVPARYPDRKGVVAVIELALKHKLVRPEHRTAPVTIEHANILVMGPEERQAYKLQLLQQAQRALPPASDR